MINNVEEIAVFLVLKAYISHNFGDFKMSEVTECPKQQKAQIKKYPKLQNILSYKMSKVTKCPKLQNILSYKMSKVTEYPKLQNVQSYNISKFQSYKMPNCPILQNFQNFLKMSK